MMKGDQAKWFLLTFKLFEFKIKIEDKKKSILYLKKKVLDLRVQKNLTILTVLILWEQNSNAKSHIEILMFAFRPFFTPAAV